MTECHNTKNWIYIAGAAALTLLLIALPVNAMADCGKAKANPCPPIVQKASAQKSTPKVIKRYESLVLGKATTLTLPSAASEVVVADPNIVEVGALKNNKLYLVGSNLGDTNILVFDQSGENMAHITVHVSIDEYSLNKTLKNLFPKEDVKAKTVGDDIMLTGDVSNGIVATRIRDVASRFLGEDNELVNMLNVKGEQQVMIKVKVVEISREILNELGTDTDIQSGTINNNTTIQGLTNNDFGYNPLRQVFGLTTQEPFGLGQLIWDPGGFNPISFMISALEQDELVNTLAEPNLTAKSGENARFLAGGEIPVVADRNDDRVTFDYRPFGVVLAFRPVVKDEGRIELTISTEVSEVAPDTSTVISGVPFPSFDVRRAETSVEMASGGSLMIAGLISSRTIHNLNEIPGLKDTPVLGELSRSDSFRREESELLIMISAYLINPTKADDFKVAKPKSRDQNNPNDHAPLRDIVTANLGERYKATLPKWVRSEKRFGYMIDQ